MNTRSIAAEYRLAHWAQIMQKRKDSGLSVRAFCERAGFHENSYFYWQRKLREATCEELSAIQSDTADGMAHIGFAEVRLTSSGAYPASAASGNNDVLIETAGVRIAAGGGYQAEKLAVLLREVLRLC